MSRFVLIGAAVLVSSSPVAGQALGPATAGPVIEGYGAVYAVESPDFATHMGPRKVVFELSQGAADPAQLNVSLNSVARYLNMHAQAGVRPEDMTVAMVVHGTAGKDLLDHVAFRRRHGVDNPNLALLERLMEAGVEVILCGQTQMHRGLRRDELVPGVQVALSAMTALVALQNDGYAFLPW